MALDYHNPKSIHSLKKSIKMQSFLSYHQGTFQISSPHHRSCNSSATPSGKGALSLLGCSYALLPGIWLNQLLRGMLLENIPTDPWAPAASQRVCG